MTCYTNQGACLHDVDVPWRLNGWAMLRRLWQRLAEWWRDLPDF